MYDKTTIHGIIFIFCILAYLVSPKTDFAIDIQEVQASKTAQTGSIWELPVSTQAGKMETRLDSSVQDAKQAHRSAEDVKMECDATCKVNTLVSLGIGDKIAGSLVWTCKEKATDPRHCIIAWASIVKNESSGGKRCKNNNCFWIGGGRFKYDTVEKWVEDWVARYNKYWYKAQSASFFYPAKWQVSRSKYCTSEHSSNSSVGCPNWLRIAQDFWNKLDKLF